MENKQTAAAISGQKDRVSTSLPDEIIHDILGRLLRSVPKQALQVYKLTLLSKRWTQIWLSYPNLEFEQDYLGPTEPQERFATAILDKFSGAVISMNTIRIKIVRYTDFYSKFIDRVLGLAADKFSPRDIDIDIEFGSLFYEPFIPESFFSSSNGGKQFLGRLSVLSFKHYGWIMTVEALNKLIAKLPSLESLTLIGIRKVSKLEIVNNDVLREIITKDMSTSFHIHPPRLTLTNVSS